MNNPGRPHIKSPNFRGPAFEMVRLLPLWVPFAPGSFAFHPIMYLLLISSHPHPHELP